MKTDLVDVFDHLRSNNERAAVAMLRRRMKNGDVVAAALYGWLKYTDERSRSEVQAFDALMSAAESGLPFAEFFVGYLYYVGWHVEQDEKQAARWYRKAARRGYPPALFALGMMYIEGDGVRQDGEKGLAYLRRVAELDGARAPGWDVIECRSMNDFLDHGRGEVITLAQGNLGIIYEEGIGGIPVDLGESVKWLTLSVANGGDGASDLADLRIRRDADDFYAIGQRYAAGNGVKPDLLIAARAYLRAIDLDPFNVEALHALADMRREANGEGYVALYERAAEQGHAKSMLSLSELYRTGQGVSVCQKTADKWKQTAIGADRDISA